MDQLSHWFALAEDKISTAQGAVKQVARAGRVVNPPEDRTSAGRFKEELLRAAELFAAEKEILERQLSEAKTALRTTVTKAEKVAESEARAIQELRDTRCLSATFHLSCCHFYYS